MKDNETISIVVPVYKVEQEINRCVDSLLKQTYKHVEIILVDDGSPDNCPEICDEYQIQDERVKTIHKSNGGLSDARNCGLAAASGEYVMFVDSDDYLEVDACERFISVVNEFTEVDFVVGAIKEIHTDCIKYQKHTNVEAGKVYKAGEFIELSVKAGEWYAPAVLNLYKKDFLIRNNLFYKTGFLFEDMEMLPRLYLAARKIIYMDYPFYNYIIRENSITTSSVDIHKQNFALEIYKGWKIQFDSVEDIKLKKALYGFLIKCYMRSCRVLSIPGWKIEGIDYHFAMQYALRWKEKMKIVYFTLFPKLYVASDKRSN